MGIRRSALLSATCLGVLATASHAYAQSADDSTVSEIIVTAEKREGDLQKTALALSVVSGDLLRQQQVTSIEGLAQSLPNVSFGQTTGNARIAIRGVGFDNISLGNEGRVAYHIDGVYVSRPAATLASFYDVARVEVLRGPQGTLYGRNATGGVVNVISSDPGQELNGYIEATYGNYDLFRLEGAVGGAMSETVSGRVAFQVLERSGYGWNSTLRQDIDDASTRAMRGKLKFAPNDAFDYTVTADYFVQDDRAYSYHYLGHGALPGPTSTPPLPGRIPTGLLVGGTAPSNGRDSTSDAPPINDREYWGVSGSGRLDLGAVELRSITAYRSSRFDTSSDIDATSARLSVYQQIEESEQFSQELQLYGDYARGTWTVGAFYFDEAVFGGSRAPFDPVVLAAAPLPPLTSLRQGFYAMGNLDTQAWALFGNITFDVTERLSVKLGGRYSEEEKSVDEVQKLDLVTPWPPYVGFFPTTPPGARRQASASWSSFTPSVTLSFQATDDLLLYATYAQGFKSGGFNLGNLQPPFAQEKITDYEAGLRGAWLDNRLRASLSGFFYEYEDLQVSKVNGTTVTIENAASAELYGMEAEFTATLTERLRVQGSLSLLETQYKDYVSADPVRAALGPLDLSGNKLNQSPAYTANLNVTYTIPSEMGDFRLRGEGRWVDHVYFTQYNLDHVSQPAYGLFNAFLTWNSPTSGLEVTGFVRNIADEDILSAAVVGTGLVGAPLLGSLEPPKTYGVTIGYSF